MTFAVVNTVILKYHLLLRAQPSKLNVCQRVKIKARQRVKNNVCQMVN